MFTFSEKATKIEEIFTVNLTVCSNRQIDGEDFIDFCSLLRKHELYHSEPSGFPYSPNQLLVLDFFIVSYSKTALLLLQPWRLDSVHDLDFNFVLQKLHFSSTKLSMCSLSAIFVVVVKMGLDRVVYSLFKNVFAHLI